MVTADILHTLLDQGMRHHSASGRSPASRIVLRYRLRADDVTHSTSRQGRFRGYRLPTKAAARRPAVGRSGDLVGERGDDVGAPKVAVARHRSKRRSGTMDHNLGYNKNTVLSGRDRQRVVGRRVTC